MKLYEAVEQLATVNDWIAEHEEEIREAGGELPPALAELLDLADGQLDEKVERVALKIRILRAEADVIGSEADRLAARAKGRLASAAALTQYLHRCLNAAGVNKVEGSLATVALQRNPPSVVSSLNLDDPAVRVRLPEPMVRGKITWSLNRQLVLEHHRAGVPLPEGLTVVIGESVRIR